jgi:small subunit ribosomal protein S4
MKLGPKYKIAKRLGAQVFEKTQKPIYAIRAERKNISLSGVRSKSNYGNQLLEKQKVRFTYGITANQLSNYAKNIINSKSKKPENDLFLVLEKRLDNIILKAGLAKSRRHARQIVSHGHIRVNGTRSSIPSFQVKKNDKITLKDSSKAKPIFLNYESGFKDAIIPSWIKVDPKSITITIEGEPTYKKIEHHFDLGAVIQFFRR